MMRERFAQQLRFLIEIDKMKSIFRQTLLIDQSRQETDAEHSWNLAIMAMVFAEYAHTSTIDLNRVIKMVLVHDLVEIYAGDTYAYDKVGNTSKTERENQAAVRLFGILPKDQGEDYRKIWEEFDAMESDDALYANAMDCVQPLLNSYMTKGKIWRENRITSGQVYQRMEKVKKGAPEIYQWVEFVIEDSVKNGYLVR